MGDLCDNCPEHHNPDQADLFPGGRGNACDRDPDRDGYQSLPVATDNCWLVVNRYQEDQDRDGHGDHCDNCVFHANPDQVSEFVCITQSREGFHSKKSLPAFIGQYGHDATEYFIYVQYIRYSTYSPARHGNPSFICFNGICLSAHVTHIIRIMIIFVA